MFALTHLQRASVFSIRRRQFISSKSSNDTVASSFADPWPLPGSPEHLTSTVTPNDELKVKPLERPNESVDNMRARLVYQTRKRGTLESDLLLSTFGHEWLPRMSEGELKEFDKLLDEPDWDIYYWATNKREPPERWAQSTLLKRLRTHTKNEEKQVRRMPDLN